MAGHRKRWSWHTGSVTALINHNALTVLLKYFELFRILILLSGHNPWVPTNLRNGTPDSAKCLFCGTHQNEPKQLPIFVASLPSYCSKQDRAKIYPRKVTLVPLFCGKELNGTGSVVSRGQTAYFSFDMGAEKNKGLAYYRYMFVQRISRFWRLLIGH